MKTWRFLLALVLLAAQNSLAEDDIGEISDDGFDPPPLMNTSGGDGKSTTKAAVKKEEEDKKKEGNATGSVEKGEKTEGKIVDGKETVLPSESKEDADKGMMKAPKATALAKSAEKETTKTEKKPVLPKSEEEDEKETPVGEKIVMVSSSDKDKKDKEEKEDALKTNVIPSKEKITKGTEEAKNVSTVSLGKKGSAEKTEEKQVNVKKPVEDKETTQRETTTVVTTVNVPLIEDSGEKKGEMVDGEGEGTSDEQLDPEGEQVTGEKEEEKKEEKKEETIEGRKLEERPYPKQPINVEYSSDSHFFSFFIFFLVLSAVGYLAYHNKRKIMALLIEGRSSSSKGGRVRYHRLANDDNFERNVIY